jgi:hypothetical protein
LIASIYPLTFPIFDLGLTHNFVEELSGISLLISISSLAVLKEFKSSFATNFVLACYQNLSKAE